MEQQNISEIAVGSVEQMAIHPAVFVGGAVVLTLAVAVFWSLGVAALLGGLFLTYEVS